MNRLARVPYLAVARVRNGCWTKPPMCNAAQPTLRHIELAPSFDAARNLKTILRAQF